MKKTCTCNWKHIILFFLQRGQKGFEIAFSFSENCYNKSKCNFKLALVPLCQLESTAHLNVIGNPLHCFWHSQELQISMAIHQLDESICAVIYQLDSEKLKNLTFPISSFYIIKSIWKIVWIYIFLNSSTFCVFVVCITW